ncbi:L-proline glycine betaine binding ABC transporter protein ProX (TC 3.A.1.12.1) [Raoultella ornithinolytica]|nr:L-proline glycine betaine binding ABC transporter protein ProX (TC 3.A.1.12.1) [Raoultella ornithinolytica]
MRHNTIIATTFATLLATSAAWAADLPGKALPSKPIQSTITEETFQTLLVSRALEKLGYTVDKPSEVELQRWLYLACLRRRDLHRRQLAAAA